MQKDGTDQSRRHESALSAVLIESTSSLRKSLGHTAARQLVQVAPFFASGVSSLRDGALAAVRLYLGLTRLGRPSKACRTCGAVVDGARARARRARFGRTIPSEPQPSYAKQRVLCARIRPIRTPPRNVKSGADRVTHVLLAATYELPTKNGLSKDTTIFNGTRKL